MEVLAILVAAGRGERMQAALPKAFLPLAGRPLLRWAAEAFEASDAVAGFVAVVPEALRAEARDVLAGLPKLRAVVAGGTRLDHGEAAMAEDKRHVRVREHALVIRAAVGERLHHATHALLGRIWRVARHEADNPGNAAH